MNDDSFKGCWSCDSVVRFTELAEDFTARLAEALSGPIEVLFAALVSLWVVIAGYKLIMRPSAVPDLIQEFFFILIAAALLGAQGGDLISAAYEAALSVMAGASATAFALIGTAPPAGDYEGFALLMAAVEDAVKAVIRVSAALFEAGNAWRPLPWLAALVLIVPFLMLLYLYFAKVIVAIFRVLMIAILAPFLLMAFAFNWGRPMAVAGVRAVMSAVIVLFAATAAVSLAIYGISALSIVEDNYDVGSAADFSVVDNADLVLAILLALLGTALMTEGVGLANSITGSMFSNTASAIIAGGLTAATVGALRHNPATWASRAGEAANTLGGHVDAWRGAGDRVADLVRRMRGPLAGGAPASPGGAP